MLLMVSFDGDKIGRAVGAARLSDNKEEAQRLDQAITRGEELWRSFALANGGSVIEIGGDEGVIEIPPDKVSEIPKIRQQYAELVGATVSVGIGMKMSEADKALMVAKLRGGNLILFYTPELANEVEEARAKYDRPEAEKQAEHYLTKGEASGSGHSVPSPPVINKPATAQGEHSEAHSLYDLLGEERPPQPEMTHASDDFLDQFHQHAQEQEEKDQKQARQPEENKDAIKAQVAGVLQKIKAHAPVLAHMKQLAPEAYESVMNLVQAVIAMARELTPAISKAESEYAEDSDFEKELEMGIEVEMEHTDDPEEAKKIAIEHLKEDSRYYTKAKECGLTKPEIGKPLADSIEKGGPIPGAPAHHHLHLPVGSTVGHKIKVIHNDGSQSWKSVSEGQILSQDPSGHATSSREPGAR